MDLPRRVGTVELRCVAADGRHLGVEGIGDVHDERRLHRILAVGEGVEDFERPVRGAPPAPPGPPGALILGEPGQVARVASQLRRDAVIGMAPDWERENHDPGPRGADQVDELRARRLIVLEVGVGEPGVEPHVHAERPGCALGLGGARGGVAARAGLSLGQVDDPDAMARPHGLGERAATRQLDVVAMRRDREQVHRLGHLQASSRSRCGMRGVEGPHPASPIPRPGYSYLNASTGSSLAALAAGAIPKTSPTVIDTIVAIAALHTGTVVLKSSRRLRSSPVPIPRMIPRTPPIKVSVAASTRNCQRTSRRVAPIALRKPISRVRLVTDTIMIAITPIPPTRSAILDSTSITKKNANVRLSKMPSTWSDVSRSKLLASPTRSPRRRRSCSVAASIARATLTSGRGLTRMISAFTWSIWNRSRAASNGTIPAISGAPGTSKMLVGRCHTPRTRNGRPPMRTISPIGSRAPNSRSTVRCSMTATGAPLRNSAVVKTRPVTSPPPRISM